MNLYDYIKMITEIAGSDAANSELKEYYRMKLYYPGKLFREWCTQRGIICNQNVI